MLDIPRRLNELWPWFNAVCAWDWGDPNPLGELIGSEPIPEEFRSVVANILTGDRKRSRNWQKGKIPASERMKIAGSVSIIIDLCCKIRTNTSEGIESIADRKGMEPIELVHKLHDTARNFVADTAKDLDVSVETIENLIREMRARIDRWPVV